ncbi:L-type lectin-domain containing receptor kinase IV.4 [Cardamine amara subsp. amara]|uniref:non-specific serine/threonine protein kinase n=1 Tax=Cardamine amara subsp. amara TaxID=228776 RepID=A0ABD1C6K1_CARAN
MFFKLFTLFFFLSFFWQCLMSSSQILDFTYNGFHAPLNNISIQGITTVTPNGLLKLTNTTMQRTGHAFYTNPIRFKDSPNGTVFSFSTTFVFAIHSESPILSSSGMAFVVSPSPRLPFGSPVQFLGLFNVTNHGKETNHVFAVELDTIMSIEFNDMNNNHVGIDINSLESVKSSSAGYWDEQNQFKNMTLISRKRMQVWIDYDGRTHRIDVSMAPFNENKPRKPLVSIVRDLSSVLLQDMFVGFSAATGSVLSEHFVLGWSFRVKGEALPLAEAEVATNYRGQLTPVNFKV